MAEPAIFRSSWKFFLIIIVSIVIVYSQAFFFDFVNYDDPDLVYENSSYLSNVSNIFNSFTTHAFATKKKESVYYRPILIISYIVDYQIWKLNPFGYHASNILFHCITAIFLFLLMDLILHNKLIAILISLFFSLHPIQVESVAWIAGRNDVLLGFFIVMMVYFYILQYEKPEKQNLYFTLSLLSFTMALFTKESAAFFLLLIPLYDLAIRRTQFKIFLSRPTIFRYLSFATILVLYLLIRINIFGETIGAERLYGKLSLSGRLQLIPAMVLEHLSLLIAPIRLCIEHPLDKLIWLESPWNIFAIIVILGIIGTAWLTWRHHRIMFFGLLWLVIGLLPTLNVIPVAVPILEHRLYTTSIGFGLLLTIFFTLSSSNSIKKVGVILTTIIIVTSTVGTFTRLPVWQNSETLWLDAIKKAPSAHRSYFNLAGYYYEHQRYDRTIDLLKKYIERKPEDFIGYSKLRQTYFVVGDYSSAVGVCRQMITMDPRNQSRYIELGLLFERLALTDSVINLYKEALQIDSTFYQIHDRLGIIYQAANNHHLAEYHFLQAIEVKHEYAASYFNLATLLASMGRNQDAIRIIDDGMKFGKPPENVLRLRNRLSGQDR